MSSRALGAFLVVLTLVKSGLAGPEPAQKPVCLVSDVWPPFTNVEGKPRQALDLVKAALERSGITTSFAIVEWSDALSALERGEYDGSAAVWKTPEREKYLFFSKPYLENRLVLVARKGVDVSAKSVVALKGKRLALTRGYAYGDAIEKAEGIKILYYDDDAAALRAVLAKQADYVLLDELVVHYLYEYYAAKAQQLIVRGTAVLARHPLHFAIKRARPDAARIVAAFDREISKMMVDGQYNELLHLPWLRLDANGDGHLDYVASTRSTWQGKGDPGATAESYAILPSPVPDTPSSPRYVIDGKSYDTWGDAAQSLGPNPKTKGIYKFSTGFVLGEF